MYSCLRAHRRSVDHVIVHVLGLSHYQKRPVLVPKEACSRVLITSSCMSQAHAVRLLEKAHQSISQAKGETYQRSQSTNPSKHLLVRQKRPTCMAKETYQRSQSTNPSLSTGAAGAVRDASKYKEQWLQVRASLKQDLLIWQKRPTWMAKET